MSSARFSRIPAEVFWAASRETDLLSFEIAIRESEVGTVMCSYNLVNNQYACENDYLLNEVLKKEWGFKGWVDSR